MSWGERSCSKENAPKNEFGGCTHAKFETCNVDCPYYTSNGREPDSISRKRHKRKFQLPEGTQSIDSMVNDFFKLRDLK